MNEPRRPDCNWRLRFEPDDLSTFAWIARCWNKNCSRDRVYPHQAAPLLSSESAGAES